MARIYHIKGEFIVASELVDKDGYSTIGARSAPTLEGALLEMVRHLEEIIDHQIDHLSLKRN